jgi:methionyl-tRNA formyltransferase
MTRVVFMGTPRFAVPTLNALAEAHRVVGVVTQPDRPAGRGRKLRQSPIKQAALRHDLPLFQPRSLRTPDALAQLADWRSDVVVVAAFGQILSRAVLDLPPYGCVNVHASLLPRWRGAAPVAAAILSGDEVTGVTIMKMDPGLDTGPILAQQEEPIRPDDTRATLMERLSYIGAELLVRTLPAYVEDDLQPRAQVNEEATFADRLRKEDGELNWSHTAMQLDRRVRAFTPWPGTFTFWHGRRLKVLRASPLPDWRGEGSPGTVVEVGDGGSRGANCAVATDEGALRLEEIQLAGKRAMAMGPFLRGHRDFVGSRLGRE